MIIGKTIHSSQLINDLMNVLPEYVKPAVYGTTDKNVIAKKEKGLQDIFSAHKSAENGKMKEAYDLLEKALHSFVETKDPLLQAFAYFFQGELYFKEYVLDKSKEAFQKAYDIFMPLKNIMFLSVGQKIVEIDKEIEETKSKSKTKK